MGSRDGSFSALHAANHVTGRRDGFDNGTMPCWGRVHVRRWPGGEGPAPSRPGSWRSTSSSSRCRHPPRGSRRHHPGSRPGTAVPGGPAVGRDEPGRRVYPRRRCASASGTTRSTPTSGCSRGRFAGPPDPESPGPARVPDREGARRRRQGRAPGPDLALHLRLGGQPDFGREGAAQGTWGLRGRATIPAGSPGIRLRLLRRPRVDRRPGRWRAPRRASVQGVPRVVAGARDGTRGGREPARSRARGRRLGRAPQRLAPPRAHPGRGGTATLEDCGSKNGTFLRGERIDAPRELSAGDEICLGQARLHFGVYAPDVSTRSDDRTARPA